MLKKHDHPRVPQWMDDGREANAVVDEGLRASGLSVFEAMRVMDDWSAVHDATYKGTLAHLSPEEFRKESERLGTHE